MKAAGLKEFIAHELYKFFADSFCVADVTLRLAHLWVLLRKKRTLRVWAWRETAQTKSYTVRITMTQVTRFRRITNVTCKRTHAAEIRTHIHSQNRQGKGDNYKLHKTWWCFQVEIMTGDSIRCTTIVLTIILLPNEVIIFSLPVYQSTQYTL